MATIEYGPPIALEDAKRVIDAAEREARDNGWAMVVAVVDGAGQLVALHRMDHALPPSVEVALAKARTSAGFKVPSKVFEDDLATGGLHHRLLALPGVCPLEGGLPLLRDGRIIGAIGVSGETSAQDGLVAAAGARRLEGGAGEA